jgi:aspartate kinase
VSIVGTGINATYENVRRGVTSLEENAIRSFGLATSSFRATWLIDRSQLDRAVRLLHALFIESVAAR